MTRSLLGIYQALLDLAEDQRRALLADDLERYFKLDSERERSFEDLKALQQEADSADEETRARMKDLISQILRVDDYLEEALEARQQQTRAEIAKLQPGMNALHAYIQEAATHSFYIDRNQ